MFFYIRLSPISKWMLARIYLYIGFQILMNLSCSSNAHSILSAALHGKVCCTLTSCIGWRSVCGMWKITQMPFQTSWSRGHRREGLIKKLKCLHHMVYSINLNHSEKQGKREGQVNTLRIGHTLGILGHSVLISWGQDRLPMGHHMRPHEY